MTSPTSRAHYGTRSQQADAPYALVTAQGLDPDAETGHEPFGVVGVSHKSAGLEILASIGFGKERIPSFLGEARTHGFSECVVLSTCNRVEMYYSGVDGKAASSFLAQRLSEARESQPDLYEHHCINAAGHAFRVASGMDSAVLGESEIVAQVKDAWMIARHAKMVGPMFDLLLKRTMEASKRVRTETDLCKRVVSAAGLAVRRAQAEVGGFEGKSLLLVGAGKIAGRLAQQLAPLPKGKVTIVNRSLEHAATIAATLSGVAQGLGELERALREADVAFAAVSSSEPVIEEEVLARAMKNRSHGPLVIVDFGVPPNVEHVALPEGVKVIGLQELNAESEANDEARQASIGAATAILEEELARFGEALIERAASPTIRALLQFGEEVRTRNLEWARQRLPELDESHLRVIDEMTRRTVIGLLEAPIQNLRTDGHWNEQRHLVEHLFALNGGE